MLSSQRLAQVERTSEMLYKAALGLTPWIEALSALTATLEASWGSLFAYDSPLAPGLPMAVMWDQKPAADYLAHYRYLDPWIIAHKDKKPLAGVSLGERILPDTDVVRTPVYNEFLGPNGMRRLLSFVVPAQPSKTRRICF